MTKALAVIAIIIFALGVSLTFYQPNKIKETTIVKFSDGTKITAEIADEPKEQELGLSFRDGLGTNDGMLFVFGYEDNWAFWMKDMRIPIDMIWVNTQGKIVHVQKNAQPCEEGCDSYIPPAPAKYVIEVNSGFSEKHGLKIGDSVEIKLSAVEI